MTVTRSLPSCRTRSPCRAGAAVAVAVTDHDGRGEAEATAALHDLGDAVDVDDAIGQVEVVGVDRSRHSCVLLELEAGFARGLGNGRDAALIGGAVAVEHHR